MMLASFLAACAGSNSGPSMVTSDVASYSVRPASFYIGKRITTMPADKAKLGSLEFDNLSAELSAKLRMIGAEVVTVEENDRAEYLTLLYYDIDNGRTETTIGSLPKFGVTGYSGANTFGSLSSYGQNGTFSSTTTLHHNMG
jgi:hypothetical protein